MHFYCRDSTATANEEPGSDRGSKKRAEGN